MAMLKPNLFYHSGREGKDLRDGVLLQNARYRDMPAPIPSIVLGGYHHGWVEKGGRKIPVGLKAPPLIGSNGRALVGSIVEVEQIGADGKTHKRKQLVAPQEKGVWYLTCRTGLLGHGSGTKADYIKLLGDLQDTGGMPVAHGSFSLDGGAVKLAEGESAGVDLVEVKADRVVWGRSQRFLDGLGIPDSLFDEWRIPVGAEVLRRDIDGTLIRYIGGKDALLIADAKGYEKWFERLEEDRKTKRAAEKAARADDSD